MERINLLLIATILISTMGYSYSEMEQELLSLFPDKKR